MFDAFEFNIIYSKFCIEIRFNYLLSSIASLIYAILRVLYMGGESKTVGEKLIEEMERISRALEGIPTQGFIRQMLILYIQEKTKLGKQKIEAVLDAIAQFRKEMEKELK